MYIENIDHFVHEEKVEDTKEVTRSHTSKDRQHNGQMKKDKALDNKTKDRATRTPLKTWGELRCSGYAGPDSHVTLLLYHATFP
jgi:hypothetical protein